MKFYSFINNQGIKTRFLSTLSANLGKIGLSFISGIIIARVLGPAGYGNYNFLLGSFVSFLALFDMGTSTAFYTFLSQRKRTIKFYTYYLSWTGMQFIVILSLIAFIFPDSWRNKIWLGHNKELIILAFVASFILNRLWQSVMQSGESVRATVTVQLHNIIIGVFYLCVLLVMFFLGLVTINNLFILISISYFLVSFILAGNLKGKLIVEGEDRLRDVINEFRIYCLPLFIYTIISFFHLFADIWLLQKFGGAAQQGFYSVGLRFNAICLIATTSMLRVFWKEIAEANELGNKERVYYLYIRISRGLCFVGALAACFLIPFSREILIVLLGDKYEAGWLCLAIMFLFPIHQSLSHINASYTYATGKTRLYSKIGIIMMIVSIFVTYFVLASPSSIIPGLGMGSAGLALKMVVIQIISVNVLTYFICRSSRWSFNFLYQFGIIILLFSASLAVKAFLGGLFHVLNVTIHPLALMVSCIPVYVSAIGVIVYFFPSISGLERKNVTSIIQFFKR